MDWLRNIWDRVAHNWATSSVAVVTGGVIVAGWFGVEISSKEVLAVIAAVQAFILLFAKDR